MAKDSFFDHYLIDPQDLFRRTHKSRVLVVDDESIIREMVMMVLAEAGCSVDGAENGLHALEFIKKAPPAALVLDLNMPQMGGLEMLQIMRRDLGLHGVRVIVFSAHITPEVERELRTLGVEVFLPKPFDVTDVLSAVRAIFNTAEPLPILQDAICAKCGSDKVTRSSTVFRSFLRLCIRSRKRFCCRCGYRWMM